ncbi:MAG: VCBS repeat-containing protein, partial [Cytophagales bacterium]|nr:VCBS repeat-containing protein [Cytophagales bacterium]
MRETRIADLNHDGLNDIVVCSEVDNFVAILLNQSADDRMGFADPLFLSSSSGGASVALGYFNQDDMLDIALVPPLRANFIVLLNLSSKGKLEFGSAQSFPLAADNVTIQTADLNSDGLSDVVISNRSNVRAFRNTGSSTALSFVEISPLVVGSPSDMELWGLALGDLNGDGELDLAAATAPTSTGSPNARRLYLFENDKASPGINFKSTSFIGTQADGREVLIADFDNNGRPDLAFTQGTNLGISASTQCVKPTLSPHLQQANLCVGSDFYLQATQGMGLSYLWKSNQDTLVGRSSDTLLISHQAGTADYKVILESGAGCVDSSTSTQVIQNEMAPAAQAILPIEPVCQGDTLRLIAALDDPSLTYYWTKPNGSLDSLSGDTLVVIGFGSDSSGLYQLRVAQEVNGKRCLSPLSQVFAQAVRLPEFLLSRDSLNFCQDHFLDIEVQQEPDLMYTWYRANSPLVPNPASALYRATMPGSYSVAIEDANGCMALE